MITAQISAADIATIGTASITVQDLSSSVQNTDAQTLTVSAPSVDAVAFQINPAHTGSVKFASVSFPTAPSWTVDVGGIPSYALIAQGKIFVTVSLGSGGSQVLALDRVTGAKVWGPVAIGGTANAAYDRGKLLVLSSPFASAATMEALDAQTGSLLWSTLLQGQYSFSGAPTARDGFVYAGGAGSGGTLYALRLLLTRATSCSLAHCADSPSAIALSIGASRVTVTWAARRSRSINMYLSRPTREICTR